MAISQNSPRPYVVAASGDAQDAPAGAVPINLYGADSVELQDAAIAQAINTPGSATRTQLTATIAGTIEPSIAAATPPPRLLNATTENTEPDPRFIEYFDGYMWGALNGDIYRSGDEGASWQMYCNSWPGVGEEAFIARIIKTSDGEVLVLTNHELRKSSGWASGNGATWSGKLVPNNGTGIFNGFGLDGDGTKFILAEYSPVPASWADSRYAYISTDAGSTFVKRYDTLALHGVGNSELSHLHGVAYDPIADRFYVGEGHGPAGGVYHSVDNGLTWAVASGMRLSEPGGNYNAPTVIIATHDGLVMGSDNTQNGLFGVVRTDDPMEQVAVQTVSIKTGREGLVMFAQRGWTDPATGLVYVTFRAEYDDTRPAIAAGTAAGGGIVYEWPTLPSVAGSDRFYIAAITAPSRMTAYAEIGGIPTIVRGALVSAAADPGNLTGGRAGAASGVAIGPGSEASAATSLAIGKGAKVAHADGLAIGALAEVGATAGTSIGVASKAGNAGVAVGRGAVNAYGADAVAVGFNSAATGNNTVAVGSGAVAPGATSVAVGQGAITSGIDSTAIGAGAHALVGAGTAVGCLSDAGNGATVVGRGAASMDGVALGYMATTGVHSDSVALGFQTTVTNAKQVAVGNRDVEVQSSTKGFVLQSPDGTRYRIRVANGGALTATPV